MATKRADIGGAFDLPPPKTKTPIAEDVAEKFVRAKPAPQPIERRVGPTKRRSGPGARINIILPFEVEDALRERAFKERRSISDAITAAITEWLGKSNE